MLTSCYMPTGDFDVVSMQKRRANNTTVSYGVTKEEAGAVFGEMFRAALRRDESVMTSGGRWPSYFGPFQCRFNNVPEPNIPDKFINCEKPVKPIHKDFQKRSREGEILLSDYYNWQAIISYIPGRLIASKGSIVRSTSWLSETGFVGPGNSGGNKWVTVGEWQYRGRWDTFYQPVTFSGSVSPLDVGWRDPVEENFSSIFLPIDGASVNETFADHNRKLVDVLTAMAEMPETIKSIYQGCKTLLRMYRDAKRKDIRLRDRIKGINSDPDYSTKQRAHDIKTIHDAIADVWLNFRYNISPTAYLVEDLIKYSFENEVEFIRDRMRQEKSAFWYTPDDSWYPSHEPKQTHRVMIKSRLEAGLASKSKAFLSADILTTAWELVPLSFVVDWFLTIGDTLSNLTPDAVHQQGATYSWKVDDVINFEHPETGAKVSIKLNAYKRKVINPSDYCRVYLNVDVNTFRQYDALALSWKMFTSNFLKRT